MFRIEDLNKKINTPVLSYIDSTGTFESTHEENIENGGIMGKSTTGSKINATYFFVPLMVFPKYIEIVSATLGYENESADIIVKLVYGNKTSWKVSSSIIEHKKGEYITTLEFNPPVTIKPLECFYFSCNQKLEKSRIVVGYRTL
jgi:hypothetical protein